MRSGVECRRNDSRDHAFLREREDDGALAGVRVESIVSPGFEGDSCANKRPNKQTLRARGWIRCGNRVIADSGKRTAGVGQEEGERSRFPDK